MLRRILVIISLMMVVLGVRAQDELPPYIYYYDGLHNGLVIERADGSDSRFIDGLTTEILGVAQLTSPMDTPPSEFPSPNGEYIGLVSYPPQIRGIESGLDVTLFAHSASSGASPTPEGYRWHESNGWGFIDYGILLAGGGVWPIASVIFNADGTIQRELPMDGNAGFLPEAGMDDYLAMGQPFSGLKTASAVATQSGYASLVGWHPTDPDQFVTFSDEQGLVFWSLADGTLQITDQQPLAAPYLADYPLQRPLVWLPEQNIVGIYQAGEIRYFDETSGEMQPVSGLDYPVLTATEDTLTLRYALSGDEIPVSGQITDSFPAEILTTGQTGIVSAGYETSAYIHAATGELLTLEGALYALTGDASPSLVALGSVYGCCIQLFDPQTGALLEQFYGTAFALALSPDGTRMATTSNGKVSIWDVSDYLNP